MLNVSEILKKIMKDYGLNQTQLSRAIDCDYTCVSRWCNGVRKPDVDTFEHILKVFGYKLNVELIEETFDVKPKSFYIEKTYNHLKSMSKEELVDYIFVMQDEDVLSNICKVQKDILKYAPYTIQRELLKEKIEDMSLLEIYFRVTKIHDGMEKEISSFTRFLQYHLKNYSNISKEVLAQAEYLVFDGEFLKYAPGGERYKISNFKLLDKNKNILDATSDDIENWEEEELGHIMDNTIGDYYCSGYDKNNIEVKLNY